MSVDKQKTDLKNFTQEQLVHYVESLGQPAFRGRQLLAWIYKPDILSFDQMTDLAKKFRQLLKETSSISRFDKAIIQKSVDGSVKFAFRLEDGNVIESVLIPEEDRSTLCVSSQVGCAMDCSFCLTGKMGFLRNLSVAEIVNQVIAVRKWARTNQKGELSNLVFMGMGEPLANLENLLDALSLLIEQRGMNFASRRITVSTCGLVPQMIRLGEQSSVNLAISLHAVDDDTRTSLMPINKKYPLAALVQGCKEYPHKKRQRIMFEYTLLQGINDSDQDAQKLANLLMDIPCKINLLAFNCGEDSTYTSPPREKIIRFQSILRKNGFTVFIRQSRGEDIAAACGQLAGKGWDEDKCTPIFPGS